MPPLSPAFTKSESACASYPRYGDYSQAPKLPAVGNAYFVWQYLLSQYEKKSAYTAMTAWKRLLSIRYKDGDDPVKVMNEFQSLNIQLIQSLAYDPP